MNAEFALVIKPARPNFIDTITSEEQKIIGDHFNYLVTLKDQGILNYAGRCVDGEFGIALFKAESVEKAHELMRADPAIIAGVFSYKIHPFHTAINV